jgi:predicted outer membrane repeat protein
MFDLVAKSTKFANCTFSGNSAAEGGAIFTENIISATVANCILWGDTPDEIAGATLTVNFSDVQGGVRGPDNIDADPMFIDPPDGDYRLRAGSPCIDAGDNTAVSAGIRRDLDGNPRFVDATLLGTTPVVDMGAYEFQIPWPWSRRAFNARLGPGR